MLNEISYNRDDFLLHFSHTFDTGGYNDIAR